MKDEIINRLNMKDILQEYGIQTKRTMFHCPFHKDENASAKAYDKTFYCFSCNKTGDIIQFVQYLFNISFKEAMQKINEDFGLGLESNIKVDYKKIQERNNRKKKEKEFYEKLSKKYVLICDARIKIAKDIEELNRNITHENWEEKVFKISRCQEKKEKMDIELDNIFEKLYCFKR